MENNQEQFSFASIIPVIRKRLWLLLILGVVAAVASAIFSGPNFIKPRYKSFAVLYPSNISPYSDESESEQLMQLLQASCIRDTLMNRFNLPAHYEIDVNAPSGRFYLLQEFNERVKVDKTRFESIEVAVMDEDPEIAKEMVETILEQVDVLTNALHESKFKEVVIVKKFTVTALQTQVDSIESRLAFLRENKGILDIEMQTKELTQGYARLIAAGKISKAKEMQNQLDTLKLFGGEFQELTELKLSVLTQLATFRSELARAQGDVSRNYSHINRIVEPEAADKKSYPVRWLIVFTAVFSTILVSIILFLLLERTLAGKTQK